MADEQTMSLKVVVTNGEYAYTRALSYTKDQTNGRGGNPGVVTIATSDTTVAFGSLTTPRVCIFKNLDDTNYVEFGPDATGMVAFMRLGPGESAMLPIANSVTVVGKANTASVDVLIECQDA